MVFAGAPETVAVLARGGRGVVVGAVEEVEDALAQHGVVVVAVDSAEMRERVRQVGANAEALVRLVGEGGGEISAESAYLQLLARWVVTHYLDTCAPRAVLLTGSTGKGDADRYSDIDMAFYYDAAIPTDGVLEAVRAKIGAERYRPLGERAAEYCAEMYVVGGVEVQIGHFNQRWMERDTLDFVIAGSDPGTVQQKAVMGLLQGFALLGEDVIEDWQKRVAEVPEELARKMVEHYLGQLFPLWYVSEGVLRRDAVAWLRQTLAEAALSVVGVLAGLNRRYWSGFQFKRAHGFLESLDIAPERVADRLDGLFRVDERVAIEELERLVGETLALVRMHMPQADTGVLKRPLAERHRPWRM
jgi:hypothetical protein